MIRLQATCVSEWPKLAWIARIHTGADRIRVYHGPCVEIEETRCVEGVWAGDYREGNFDRTDLIFGSGIRCRGEEVIFVSSGTTDDRLWYCGEEGGYWVSNSLPCLMALAGLELPDEYPYVNDLRTISKGLRQSVRTFPTSSQEIHVVYFNNLAYDGHGLREVEKPDCAPRFGRFGEYYDFLVQTAKQLGLNLRDRARNYPVHPLATISQGYDAPAAAVISRFADCHHAVTIKQSTSLWRGSDSGEEIAEKLGLSCALCNRTARQYRREAAVWAACGRGGILNWTLFDYPEPLCLLFTGSHGDRMWNRERIRAADPFAGAAAVLGGLCEYRLFQGIFHCPAPFWGRRHFQELQEISFSEEMAPWTLHSDYDRPIPRRIVEEAGVERGAFGTRKKNTSLEAAFVWPYSPDAKKQFREYLNERKRNVPSDAGLGLLRVAGFVNNMLYGTVFRRMGIGNIGQRYLDIPASSLIFSWANYELKKEYERGLRSSFSAGSAREQENRHLTV